MDHTGVADGTVVGVAIEVGGKMSETQTSESKWKACAKALYHAILNSTNETEKALAIKQYIDLLKDDNIH